MAANAPPADLYRKNHNMSFPHIMTTSLMPMVRDTSHHHHHHQNNTNSNDSVMFYPLVKQPGYMIATFSVSYGMVLILALLGNACVLAVVIKDKRFHSATYVFIANLAVADLLVALFCNPITLLTNIFNGSLSVVSVTDVITVCGVCH
ncbi:hypothetical protein ACOMHN_057173 [Nucella lapillus]